MLRNVLILVPMTMMFIASAAWADLPGDCDGNGVVDRGDVDIARAAIGSADGDDDFLIAADMDGDGVISVADLGAILEAAASE